MMLTRHYITIIVSYYEIVKRPEFAVSKGKTAFFEGFLDIDGIGFQQFAKFEG
jgi:hypothetical protein